MPFKKKTVTIDTPMVSWINKKIEEKEFANFSHAVQKALVIMKKSYEEK